MTMDALLQDLRFSWRNLLHNPGFTLTVLAALASGIAANTAIFSVANGVLFQPLPYEDPTQLVMVWEHTPEKGKDTATPVNFMAWRERSEAFEELVAFRFQDLNLTEGDVPRRLRVANTTDNFFTTLGVPFHLGGPGFNRRTAGDGEPVIVLKYGLWQSLFAGAPDIVGRSLRLNGESYSVTGIMPAGFDFPRGVDAWIRAPRDVPRLEEVTNQEDPDADLRASFLRTFGRLRDGQSLANGQFDMDRLAAQMREESPELNRDREVRLVPLREELVGDVRPMLLLLLAGVFFVQLIACANVANLLLARAGVRNREMSIRTALGASRGRLVRQLISESFLLASIAGLLGLLLGAFATRVLVRWLGPDIPRIADVGLDPTVILFTLLLTLFTSLLFGILPALQLSRTSVSAAISVGEIKSSDNRRQVRTRKLLIVLEIALIMMLLVGAGLMLKSFFELLKVEPGLDPQGVVAFEIPLPMQKYPEGHQRVEFFRQAIERIAELPDVKGAAAVLNLPLTGSNISLPIGIQGKQLPDDRPRDGYQLVTSGYFETLGIPLLMGRTFTPSDAEGQAPVAIISDRLKQRYWGDEDPIGQKITHDNPSRPDALWRTVVGVVGSVYHDGVGGEARAEVYVPLAQDPWPPFMQITVRHRLKDADPMELVPQLRQIIASVDAEQPLADVQTLEHLGESAVADSRLTSRLLSTFAFLALLLGALGIYGLQAYGVVSRQREIGIRMAIGEQRGQIVRDILLQGLHLTLLGLALGTLGAALLGGMLGKFQTAVPFEVGARDLGIFGITALTLLVVSLLASFFPALRASHIEPASALRNE